MRFTDGKQSYSIGEEMIPGVYYSPYPPFLRRDTTTEFLKQRVHCCLHVIKRKLTINGLAIKVTVAAVGSHARLGIYSCSKTTYLPDRLLLDGGEVDTSATGIKTAVVNYQLPPDLYWFAYLPDDAIKIYNIHSYYDDGCFILGGGDLNHSAVGCYTTSHSLASLPDPFGATSTEKHETPNMAFKLASLD